MATKLVKGTKYQIKVEKDWLTGKVKGPWECPICKAKEYYEVKADRVHEELVIIHYACLNCGHTEQEPID